MNKTVVFVTMVGIRMREFVFNVYLDVSNAKIVLLVIHVTLDCILIGMVLNVLIIVQVKKKYSLEKISLTNKLYVTEIVQFTGKCTTIRYASITSN